MGTVRCHLSKPDPITGASTSQACKSATMDTKLSHLEGWLEEDTDDEFCEEAQLQHALAGGPAHDTNRQTQRNDFGARDKQGKVREPNRKAKGNKKIH